MTALSSSIPYESHRSNSILSPRRRRATGIDEQGVMRGVELDVSSAEAGDFTYFIGQYGDDVGHEVMSVG